MTWFDAKNETAKLNDFSLIEPGVYVATITEVGLKDDQYGNEYIRFELTFENRRKYFDNVYMAHPQFEDMATKGRARLKLYALLAGLDDLKGPNDLKRLIGAQYRIQMGAYTPKNGFDKKNVINNILPLEDVATGSQNTEDDVPMEEAPAPVRAAPVAARRPIQATPVRR
jgi:hypothetical protein